MAYGHPSRDPSRAPPPCPGCQPITQENFPQPQGVPTPPNRDSGVKPDPVRVPPSLIYSSWPRQVRPHYSPWVDYDIRPTLTAQ